jgi:hypothetical protein
MHTYSTDNDKRPVVYGVLGILSYLIVLAIGWITSQLTTGLPVIKGGTLSWGITFGITSALFIRYVWKTRPSRFVRASKVPDLSGEWEGYIETTYQGQIDGEALHTSNDPTAERQRVAATLYIDQTWRKVDIHLSTANSESDSTGATILIKEGRWPSLTYQYMNEPGVNSEDSMNSHDGTADLSLKKNDTQRILEGFYYTGPDRESYGEMYFEQQ